MDHEFRILAKLQSPETKSDASPCRTEGHKLLELAEAITAAKPVFASVFADWQKQMESLLDDPDLESLNGEAKLENLALKLRRIWLSVAHYVADQPLKSPPYMKTVALPFSKDISYVYERVLSPYRLERRCQERFPSIPDWESRFCLFGSAMGGLATLLQVLPRFLAAEGDIPRWDSFAGYYETHRLLRMHDGRGLYCRLFYNSTELLERVATGKTDILFVEPSMYDWDQTILAPPRLVRAILRRPLNRPLALVLDTSLLGPAFKIRYLLRKLAKSCPLLVVELRSGVKLDQDGLELTNVGIIRLFTRNEGPPGIFGADKWYRHLRSARKILGNALSLDEMSILDLPWFCDPKRLPAYAEAIFANNTRLAATLVGIDGLFSSIAHPSLSELAKWQWAESPFVIAHFHDHEDMQANHDLLEAVLYHEVERRGLTVHFGASFGFRHHRFEIVRPFGYERPDGSMRGFLKIAMGHRAGPSCDGLINLLCEIAAHTDFASLRHSYPDIQPLEPTRR